MAKKKKVPKPDADGFLYTGIYRRDCRPRKSMTPHEYLEYMEERILKSPPPPTIYRWLDQHLEFFASILRPHVKPATPRGSWRRLNMGDGWQGFHVADDLDETCRDAIEGMDAIHLLQLHVDANGDLAADGGKMSWVIQQTYNLGRIIERINAVRPFEHAAMIGLKKSRKSTRTAENTNNKRAAKRPDYVSAVKKAMAKRNGPNYTNACIEVANNFDCTYETVRRNTKELWPRRQSLK